MSLSAFFATKPPGLRVHMAPSEFSQVLAVVEAIVPKNCLEWGSGGSTHALLERCPFIERYVSLEHDLEWYARVRAGVADSRLSLHLVRPDVPGPPASARLSKRKPWELRAEADPAIMRSYVAFPATLGLKFHFVLVDGRARNFCIPQGLGLLEPGGVLLLHDAQRDEYRDTLQTLGRVVYFTPWKRGQVCLIRKP